MSALPALPALVEGVVWHRRTEVLDRELRHRTYQWLVDLDDLPRLPAALRPFATFRSVDHVGDPQRSIKENVTQLVRDRGVDLADDARIVMLANARVLGYVFNPISVFWCYDRDERLACVVAEVHNTYGQRHAYVLRADELTAPTAKQLYVSPFFDVTGHYDLRLDLTPERVRTAVVLRRDGARALAASFTGEPLPATTSRIARVVLRHPLMPQRVTALIRMHGVRLWARRLPVQPRPDHLAPTTMTANGAPA